MSEIAWDDWLEFLPIDPDAAGPVGAVAHSPSVPVMRVGRNDGTLTYLGETAVYRSFERRSVGKESWLRLEFRVGNGKGPIHGGHFVIQAHWPYSSGWVQSARFKPPWKGGPDRRPSAPTDKTTPTRSSVEIDLIQWTETMPFDYWETGKYLVAGISIPNIPRRYMDRSYEAKTKGQDLLGSSEEDPKLLVEELLNCGEVKELLKQTEDNRIRFGPPDNPITRLHREVQIQGPALMEVSIRQALAGPRKAYKDKAGTTWEGRPVCELVDQIFRDHLYNYNRAEGRRLGRERSGSNNEVIDDDDGEE